MPGENLSRDEARERAALLSVDSYDVSLDVRSAVGDDTGDGPRTFRSVTTIRFRCAEPGATSFADLIAPGVTAVSLNGKDLDPSEVFDGSRIALEDLAAENELVVDARCAYSRTGEGLHRFVDPEDGEVYLYTQYEPADSRRVFANFEQPDLKAPFRFEVRAPEGWTVWSNGVGAESDGVWRFAETKPISTYITCVVAGPYHYVTDSYEREFKDGTRLEIPLGALCRKGLAPHFDADDVFLVTKQGLDFFHDHFDYPYPFGKYDQAFVPEYNLGAMENPGLVTFREEFIFRGKVTQASYEGRANVILHEMAHMWFGDLVTMRWWDDLWLKESFADFMGAFALVGATRFEDGWITFANRRKAWAYRADQLPSTHPVTADIRDLQDAKLNFNSLTPQVLLDAEGRVDELAVVQEAAESHPELRPHRVAVGLYRRTPEGALERYARAEADVEGPRTVVAELAGAEAPELVLVNDDDLTYCKIRFDANSLETLKAGLGDLTDPLARALCWSALWNMTRDALLPARDFVDLVLRFAGRESGIGVLQMLHAWANAALVNYLAPEYRQTGGRLLAEGALRELRAAEPGSEHQLAWARFFASTAALPDDLELLKGLLAGTEQIDGLVVDQELRWVFLEPLAAHGAADEKALAAELARDDTASGKRHQVRCLAARPSAAVKAQAWAQLVESDALSNALVEATIAGFDRSSQRELLAPYAEKYFAVIERVWRERSIQIAMHVVQGLFPSLQQSPATLDAADAWLAAHEDAAPALRRLVLEGRDDLARALRGQACDAESAA